MARSKLPEDTVIRLVKCQRWGVCDEGTADICAVDLKTVHRFQRVAAQRAETHHWQSVQDVEGTGMPLDEAHSKLRPKQVESHVQAHVQGVRLNHTIFTREERPARVDACIAL
jgi:hypothetical protein